MPKPKQDEYGYISSSPITCKAIAHALKDEHVMVVAWTDNAGTALDLLLAYRPLQVGMLQGGMSTRTDLFVAVSRIGFFGFDATNDTDKHSAYVGEKLGLGGEVNPTTTALAALINGIIRELGHRPK